MLCIAHGGRTAIPRNRWVAFLEAVRSPSRWMCQPGWFPRGGLLCPPPQGVPAVPLSRWDSLRGIIISLSQTVRAWRTSPVAVMEMQQSDWGSRGVATCDATCTSIQSEANIFGHAHSACRQEWYSQPIWAQVTERSRVAYDHWACLDQAPHTTHLPNTVLIIDMSLFLGLDVGTQSCKALVWDSRERRVVSSGQKAYDVITTRPGQAEQDPQTWIDVRICGTASSLAHKWCLLDATLEGALKPRAQRCRAGRELGEVGT